MINIASMTVERNVGERGVTLAGVSLTPREYETFRLKVLGNGNRKIGEQMGISVKTVEANIARINSKVRSLNGGTIRRGKILMAVAAVKRGLVEFPDLGQVELNSHEDKVAALTIRGMYSGEIGEQLNMPQRHVDHLLTNTYRKFGIQPSGSGTTHYLELTARVAHWGLRNGYN